MTIHHRDDLVTVHHGDVVTDPRVVTCDCEAVLRADAEELLTNADAMKARGHHKNAEASRRHAMSLALAAGHLRRHEKDKQT